MALLDRPVMPRGAAAGRVGTDDDVDLAGVDPPQQVAVPVAEHVGGDLKTTLVDSPGFEVDQPPVGELDQRPDHVGDQIAEVQLHDLPAGPADRCSRPRRWPGPPRRAAAAGPG